VTLVTGALAVWNVGIAFVAGMAAYALNKRGWLRVDLYGQWNAA
jgi:hypothetical protein